MAISGQLGKTLIGTISGTSQQVLLNLVPGVNALRQAFQAHFGKPLSITDSYRPYEVQERIFRERYSILPLSGRPYRVWNGARWYQRVGTAVAAVPGTSNHGWGTAIDFGSGVNSSLRSAEYLWMRAWAPKFGWNHPLWARNPSTLEPWHWEGGVVPVSNYIGVPGVITNPGPIGPTPGPIRPTPTPPPIPEEDIMASIDDLRAVVAPLANSLAQVSGQLAQVQIQATNSARDAAVSRQYAMESNKAASQAVILAEDLVKTLRLQGVDTTTALWALKDLKARINRTNTFQYAKVTARTYAELTASAKESTYEKYSGALSVT